MAFVYAALQRLCLPRSRLQWRRRACACMSACITHCLKCEIPFPARNPGAADLATAQLKERKIGETGMTWWACTNFFSGAVQLVVFLIVVFRDEFAKITYR